MIPITIEQRDKLLNLMLRFEAERIGYKMVGGEEELIYMDPGLSEYPTLTDLYEAVMLWSKHTKEGD